MGPSDDDKLQSLVRMLQQQHEALNEGRKELRAHSKESRDLWAEHEKEHRAHDKEHSEIWQRQVKIEDRLQFGNTTFEELKRSTKDAQEKLEAATRPPSYGKILAVILVVLSIPTGAAIWIMDGNEKKADKATVAKLWETKADKTDVTRLEVKIDELMAAFNKLAEKKEGHR